MKRLIRRLVETFGPSGREDEVRALIEKEIRPYVDDIRVDALGNLIAYRSGNGSGRRLMLAAHMDEIGLIASYVDEKGFVRVNPVGGVRLLYDLYGRVRFENGVVGVIAAEKVSGGSQVPPFDKVFVDVGAESAETCPVRVGDVACFLQPLAVSGDRLIAKAMDDRIGCAVLVEALRTVKETPYDLYAVFTVQEELGTRGALTSTYGVEPDAGIAIDVTLTGDTPEPDRRMAVSLGRGPAVKVKDGGMMATPWVVDWMVTTAERAGVPYQLEVLVGGTTDARAMQTTRAGVPAGCLSVPCRYVHSPSEMVSYRDVRNSVRLLRTLLEAPPCERLRA